MTAFLASVTDAAEAEIAIAGGADLIDFKAPEAGVLGAVTPEVLTAGIKAVAGRKPTSATIGDRRLDIPDVLSAINITGACGPTFIKVGLFDTPLPQGVIASIGLAAREEFRLIAVIFADKVQDFSVIDALAMSGWAGVMLDTADKDRGSLRRNIADTAIAHFVANARRQGLLVGLAGSLSASDVLPLLSSNPDFLGFRKALCGGRRTGKIDTASVQSIRALIPLSPNKMATAAAGPVTAT